MKYRIYLITTENNNLNGFVFFTDEIKTLNVILKNNKAVNIKIQGTCDKTDISIDNDYERELEIIEEINNQENILKEMYKSIFNILQERYYSRKTLEWYLQKLKDYKITTVIIEKIKIGGNEIDIYSTNTYSKNMLILNKNTYQLEIYMKAIEYKGDFLEKKIKIIEQNIEKKESLSNYTYLETAEIIKTFKSINLIYGIATDRVYLQKKAKRNQNNIYIADNFLQFFNELMPLLAFENNEATREKVLNGRHKNIPYNLEEIIYDEFIKNNETLKLISEIPNFKEMNIDYKKRRKFFEHKTIFILHKVLEHGGKIYFVLDGIIPKKTSSYKELKKINLEKGLAKIIYNSNNKYYSAITSAELRSIFDKYDKCPGNLIFMLEEHIVVIDFKKMKMKSHRACILL